MNETKDKNGFVAVNEEEMKFASGGYCPIPRPPLPTSNPGPFPRPLPTPRV
ncbi:MAG: hypothetical protein K6G18_03915 [Treponema sp.]|nr:hypothetical protein [Treponema sp.]